MSRPNMAVITVRFYVGEDREDSLIKLYNKIAMHTDIVPPGVTGWVVKPIEIDDVPIVDVTLWSERADGFELRRIAEQVEVELQAIPKTGRTEVVGGQSRQISVWLDSEALAAYQVSPLEINRALEGANVNLPSGSIQRENRQLLIESGHFLGDVTTIGKLVVGVDNGRPVYLRDVARIEDGPEHPAS